MNPHGHSIERLVKILIFEICGFELPKIQFTFINIGYSGFTLLFFPENRKNRMFWMDLKAIKLL